MQTQVNRFMHKIENPRRNMFWCYEWLR